MSEEKIEALSALVDGELSSDDGPRLLDQVISDASLRRRWGTYHLIGDVMRKHVIDQQGAEDPPRPAAMAPARGRGLSPLAGLALAASVAAIATLGIFALTETAQAPVDVARTETGARVPVSWTPESVPVVAGGALGIDLARMTWNDAGPAVSTRLNGYLVTHNEYLSNGMRGMLPYARIVAYDGGQN